MLLLLLSTGTSKRTDNITVLSLDALCVGEGEKKRLKSLWSSPAGSQVSYFPPPSPHPRHTKEQRRRKKTPRRKVESGWWLCVGLRDRRTEHCFNVGIRAKHTHTQRIVPRGAARRISPVGVLHQPMKHGVQVRLLSCRDTIARHLSARYALEVHHVNQLVDGEPVWEVRFVAQHQERDADERLVAHEDVELLLGRRQHVHVGDVDDEDDGVDAAAISLPHLAEAGLPTQVPALECHMPFLHPLHVEAHRWDGAAIRGQPGSTK